VQGEFYWRVQRDERAAVTDYVGTGRDSKKRLSREQTRSGGAIASGKMGTEVVWSAGETLDAAVVADAFGIPAAERAAMQRDVAPRCQAHQHDDADPDHRRAVRSSSDRCDELRQTFGPNSNEYRQCVAQRGSGTSSRTSGGSWGGGGGHK
jgi:hypothetical protein